jgi:hypothetical protein
MSYKLQGAGYREGRVTCYQLPVSGKAEMQGLESEPYVE